MKKYEDLKSSCCSWQIGLCHVSKECESTFWRLEMQVFKQNNMLVIEAMRDINSSTTLNGNVVRSAMPRRMKKLRRMYRCVVFQQERAFKQVIRLPMSFDIATLSTKVVDDTFLLSANRKPDEVPAGCLRRASTIVTPNTFASYMRRSNSVAAATLPQ